MSGTRTYLDTHVVAWLHQGQPARLPQPARAVIERDDLIISPAVVLELEYLFEVGRITERARAIIDSLQRRIGLEVCDLPFPRVVEVALDQRWTRDPFDRLIVSQAMLRDATLVTRDRTIHEHYPRALWSP